MEQQEYDRLARGDGIVVHFASYGTQYAKVARRNRAGLLVVHKWRAKSASWTGPVTVVPGEVIRRAVLGEFRMTVSVTTAPGWRSGIRRIENE